MGSLRGNTPSALVLTSRLQTEFLDGCVKHRRRVPMLHLTPRSSTPDTVFEELWDIEPIIGRGSFGVVRFERLRDARSTKRFASSAHRVRAVKEISKRMADGHHWDYMKELEAIAKFSQPSYAPYFVRTRGWFENPESVFITMEYFPLGDLRRFMDSRPPFPEDVTSHITRQLTRGISFMHDSGFAHRDLKPANVLVASVSPRWSVKIADFGISKQTLEGGTHLRTMHIGTFGYMAPEVLGFYAQNNPSVAYSVTVDMWAIGVVALELLMKRHPFPNVSDLVSHVHSTRPLPFYGVPGVYLSEACRDFIGGLLTPDPAARPSASSAATHPWLQEIKEEISDSEDEPLFVEDHPRDEDVKMRPRDAVTPASLPSLAWSNLRLTQSAPASDAGTLMTTHAGLHLDRNGLLPSFQALSLETTRYFVLRSNNELDIETSIAHGIWTSSPRVNKIIEKGHTRASGRVVFFFSVIKSQRFCGVAQMTSPMDWDHTDEHWMEDSWRGRFTVDWLCLTELAFSKVKNVPVSQRTPGFRAIACYDGTEISAESAHQLLKAFSAEEGIETAGPGDTVIPSGVNQATVP